MVTVAIITIAEVTVAEVTVAEVTVAMETHEIKLSAPSPLPRTHQDKQ